MTSTSNTNSLQKTLFIFRQKIKFIHLPSFLKYYKNITNLLFWEFGHVHQKQHKFVRNWRLSAKKNQLDPSIFQGYYTLKNPEIWLVKNNLENNFRTRNLPGMRFAMEDKNYKKFHFALLFGKTKWKNFQKSNIPYFGALFSKSGQKWIVHLMQKIRKLWSQFYERLLTDKRTDGLNYRAI